MSEGNAIFSGTDTGGGCEELGMGIYFMQEFKFSLVICQSAKMLFTTISLSFPILSWTMFPLGRKPIFALMLQTEHKIVGQRERKLFCIRLLSMPRDQGVDYF